MRFWGAIVIAFIALLCKPEVDVVNTPLGGLTMSSIVRYFAFIGLSLYAVLMVFYSLEVDKFWPWRWTKRIVLGLLARAMMLGCVIGTGILFIDEYPILAGALIILVGAYAVFMPEDELLGPEKKPEIKSSTASIKPMAMLAPIAIFWTRFRRTNPRFVSTVASIAFVSVLVIAVTFIRRTWA